MWVTREYTMYGRYKLRLYDGARMKWRTVVVDDYIPCECVQWGGVQGTDTGCMTPIPLFFSHRQPRRSAGCCPTARLPLLQPFNIAAFQCRAGN